MGRVRAHSAHFFGPDGGNTKPGPWPEGGIRMMKNLKWNLILMSLMYLALGVFLLAVPGVALNIVCYALGGVVLACAAVQLIRYFTFERKVFQSSFTLVSGLVCLGLGGFLIL